MKKVIAIFAISAVTVLSSCASDNACEAKGCDSTAVATDSAVVTPAVDTVKADSATVK